MNQHPRFIARIVTLLVLAGMAAAAGDAQSMDAWSASKRGASLGGRGMYFKPLDADHGTWSGGAQLRLHFTQVLAVEGSIDYRQSTFAGKTTDVYPVQASLLLYLLPSSPLSPFLLGGGGWYYSHTRSQTAQNRFGPHAGGGVELFMNEHWSLDGTYRYVWVTDVNSQGTDHPLGRNFRDRGHMVTAGLNYRF